MVLPEPYFSLSDSRDTSCAIRFFSEPVPQLRDSWDNTWCYRKPRRYRFPPCKASNLISVLIQSQFMIEPLWCNPFGKFANITKTFPVLVQLSYLFGKLLQWTWLDNCRRSHGFLLGSYTLHYSYMGCCHTEEPLGTDKSNSLFSRGFLSKISGLSPFLRWLSYVIRKLYGQFPGHVILLTYLGPLLMP